MQQPNDWEVAAWLFIMVDIMHGMVNVHFPMYSLPVTRLPENPTTCRALNRSGQNIMFYLNLNLSAPSCSPMPSPSPHSLHVIHVSTHEI
jgi:hypothetical protein